MDNISLYHQLLQAFGFEPTEGQLRVMRHLSAFMLSQKPLPVYLLKGYAGTGKTSLVKAIVKAAPSIRMRVVLLAPTGRAAKVLSHYTGMDAATIHRRIYFHTRSSEGQYKSILGENKLKNTLFVVDEASMISDSSTDGSGFSGRNLLDDLIAFVAQGTSCRLLLIGDQAQLPPVGMDLSPALDLDLLKASYPITAASFELSEVMRQALDSGILFNATNIRNKLQIADFALPLLKLGQHPDIQKTDGYELEELLFDAFGSRDFSRAVVVCRSNKKANQYNQAVRQRILGMDDEIAAGDLVMAVKNNYYWLEETEGAGFLANGDIFEIQRISRFEEMYGFHFAHASLQFTDEPEQAPFECILLLESLHAEGPALSETDYKRLTAAIEEDYADEPSRRKRFAMMRTNPYFNALQIKFAYALTCHKTQGGQWPLVFLEAGIYQEEQLDLAYLRWLYTAVTRATEKLYLLNFIDGFFEE